MKLSELITHRPLTLHYDTGDLNLTYNPRAVRLQHAETEQPTAESIAAQFCTVVANWDLLRDDGTPWPLEPDLLFDHLLADGSLQQGLPQELLKDILERIGEEVASPLSQRSARR